jgi:PAS domain S-box-containing protein
MSSQRPRILVHSSRPDTRSRVAAALSPGCDVVFDPAGPPPALTIADERDDASGWADLFVAGGFDADRLRSDVAVRLELARVRSEAFAGASVLLERAERARERLEFLVSAAELANAPDAAAAASALCAATVPRLAQWCAVFLRGGASPEPPVSRHSDPRKSAALRELARLVDARYDRRDPLHRVLSSGRAELCARVPGNFAARLASDGRHRRLIETLGPASYMVVPLRARGRVIGAVGLATDASRPPLAREDLVLAEQLAQRAASAIERSRVEAALRRQKAEHEAILHTVRAMIWFKDADNRVIRCNKAAARWIGLPVSKIEGRRVEDLFPAERARVYRENDRAVIASGKPRVGELEELPRRGRPSRWIQRDILPYRDARGKPIGVVIIAVDVTASRS